MAFQNAAPLRDLPRYPITGGLALAAVAVSLAKWGGRDVEPLILDARAWYGEPWRFVTSVLPHLDLMHLAFNLYWLWVFGTILESTLGRLATAGIMLLFAVGGALAEYDLFVGGVGLSGVGYGLFGLLWVLSRWDPRFAGVVDARTTYLFLGWFVLCCVLTAADIWRVGNAAHAGGAVLGAMLGLAMVARRAWRRAGAVALLVAAVGLLFVGGTVARGYVNLSGRTGTDMAVLGYADQTKGDEAGEVVWYRRALAQNGREADWWYNLGVAYLRLERPEDALDAFERANDRRPEEKFRTALEYARGRLAWRERLAPDMDAAIARHRQELPGDEGQGEFWFRLGEACEKEGRAALARSAYARSVALDPTNSRYRAARKAAGE